LKDNRTIVESARSMMISSNLDKMCWAKLSIQQFVYSKDYQKRLSRITPDIGHVSIFGCEVWKKIKSLQRNSKKNLKEEYSLDTRITKVIVF
jgi:hypothetical protein